jgi:WD40 repeat protein
VKVFSNGLNVASRSMDDTMKLWDIRNTKEAVFTWKDLANLSSKTNICISPNETMILTGTSVRKGFGFGHIMAFDVATGDLKA